MLGSNNNNNRLTNGALERNCELAPGRGRVETIEHPGTGTQW